MDDDFCCFSKYILVIIFFFGACQGSLFFSEEEYQQAMTDSGRSTSSTPKSPTSSQSSQAFHGPLTLQGILLYPERNAWTLWINHQRIESNMPYAIDGWHVVEVYPDMVILKKECGETCRLMLSQGYKESAISYPEPPPETAKKPKPLSYPLSCPSPNGEIPEGEDCARENSPPEELLTCSHMDLTPLEPCPPEQPVSGKDHSDSP